MSQLAKTVKRSLRISVALSEWTLESTIQNTNFHIVLGLQLQKSSEAATASLRLQIYKGLAKADGNKE